MSKKGSREWGVGEEGGLSTLMPDSPLPLQGRDVVNLEIGFVKK